MTANNETPARALVIYNVHLPLGDRNQCREELFTVRCERGIIEKISPFSAGHDYNADDCILLDGKGGILVPSLCHSHIHLDKCNILPLCDDLVSGTFQEAIQVTSKAKASYQSDDLLSRGRALILESVKYGVTAMRAHVEVDAIVQFKCVDAGLLLKEELQHICDVGLAVFAQDPLFMSQGDAEASENLSLLQKAAAKPGISAVGSAPYVEQTLSQSRLNIDHVFDIALSQDLHVDFHLDYNISPTTKPLTYYVIQRLRGLDWKKRMPGKHVTIGHAPRLGLLSSEELRALYEDIKDLPVTLVGLPQTDMYMLGRDDPNRPRGTLRVTELVKDYGLDVAMAVNNVGNAFTPQGSLDPLSLCTFGVAVFQAGTQKDCNVLLEAVSNTSKRAAGYPCHPALSLSENDAADLLLVHANESIQSLVLNPGYERTVIKNGKVVASKRAVEFVVHPLRI
ncbi:Metallo-dependent hydrolase [Gautieria morchelliformis]|nr:Metallo-dependent hydrolase [Gautieria morchelliformis]